MFEFNRLSQERKAVIASPARGEEQEMTLFPVDLLCVCVLKTHMTVIVGKKQKCKERICI